MIGILVTGENHFILRGLEPEEAAAFVASGLASICAKALHTMGTKVFTKGSTKNKRSLDPG